MTDPIISRQHPPSTSASTSPYNSKSAPINIPTATTSPATPPTPPSTPTDPSTIPSTTSPTTADAEERRRRRERERERECERGQDSDSDSDLDSHSDSEDDEENDKYIPVIFQWTLGGDKVNIMGSWDAYKRTIKLDKSGMNEHTALIYLPKGKFEYKFVVDDQFKFNPSLPHSIKHQSNLISVDCIPRTFDDVKSFPSASPNHLLIEASSPVSSYGQFQFPSYHASDPPNLPPHLQARALKPLPDDISPKVVHQNRRQQQQQQNNYQSQYNNGSYPNYNQQQQQQQHNSQYPHNSQYHYSSSPASPCPTRPDIDVYKMNHKQQQEEHQQHNHHGHSQYPNYNQYYNDDTIDGPGDDGDEGNDGGTQQSQYSSNHNKQKRKDPSSQPTAVFQSHSTTTPSKKSNTTNVTKRIRPFYSHVFIDHLYEAKTEAEDYYTCMSQSCRMGSKLVNTVLVVNTNTYKNKENNLINKNSNEKTQSQSENGS